MSVPGHAPVAGSTQPLEYNPLRGQLIASSENTLPASVFAEKGKNKWQMEGSHHSEGMQQELQPTCCAVLWSHGCRLPAAACLLGSSSGLVNAWLCTNRYHTDKAECSKFTCCFVRFKWINEYSLFLLDCSWRIIL